MEDTEDTAMRRVLAGLAYPCDREQLIRHAAAHGADDDVLGHLCALPEDHFDGAADVDAALARNRT